LYRAFDAALTAPAFPDTRTLNAAALEHVLAF
jgi:hypothetical protein